MREVTADTGLRPRARRQNRMSKGGLAEDTRTTARGLVHEGSSVLSGDPGWTGRREGAGLGGARVLALRPQARSALLARPRPRLKDKPRTLGHKGKEPDPGSSFPGEQRPLEARAPGAGDVDKRRGVSPGRGPAEGTSRSAGAGGSSALRAGARPLPTPMSVCVPDPVTLILFSEDRARAVTAVSQTS